MLIHKLPYNNDSSLLFAQLAHLPWAQFLDSGQQLETTADNPASQYGRFDILVAEPFATLVTTSESTAITQYGAVQVSADDPFAILKNMLRQYQAEQNQLPFAGDGFPFAGGALGYFSYDLSRRLEKLPHLSQAEQAVPEMMIGLYDWAIVVDHHEKTTHLLSHALTEQTKTNWQNLCKRFENLQPTDVAQGFAAKYFEVTSKLQSNLSQAQYNQAFSKIQRYIEAGDCYQVNLAQRFSVQVQGDAWAMYKQWQNSSPAPLMAFMNLPLADGTHFQVLSNSPERFIKITGEHVETLPIKGTRPRFKDAKQDLASANALLASAKDQAENVMIVDLLRNDLSKSCSQVRVSKLFQLQSFANVHHLVSMVVAKLKPAKTAVDVLRDCFPGGSITGVPKLRAMQIIEELEPHRRGLYCGAIGYIGFDGNMDTSIAIRTAVHINQQLSFYTGGGIVADSVMAEEYAETLDKAASFNAMIKLFTVQS